MLYGCIGEKLTHSYSSEVHEAFGNPDYALWELTAAELPAFLTEKKFRGINVTIPYKKAVLPYLDEISETAKQIGAVNTILHRGGRLYGTNTDYAGMMALLQRNGMCLAGQTVLILGSGGTSRTAKAVAQAQGASEIYIVSRTPGNGQISYAQAYETDAAYILNTTPCGMHPDSENVPIEPERFRHLRGVLDAVYNPLRSELVRRTQQMGVPAAGGLYMLVAQAAESAKLFYETDFSAAQIEAVYQQIAKGKENIVLFGMPSAGKSNVGRQVAALLKRPFWDSDAWIEQKAGRKIPQIFAEQGEASFRVLEEEMLLMFAETLRGGVIAVGGGAVQQEKAVRALRRNGFTVFLDRPLSLLQTGGNRPLSADKAALQALFETRQPLYEQVADVRIENCGTVQEAAERVIRSFTDR